MHAHSDMGGPRPGASADNGESTSIDGALAVADCPDSSLADSFQGRRLLLRWAVCADMSAFVADPARAVGAVHDSLLALGDVVVAAAVGALSSSGARVDGLQLSFARSLLASLFAGTFATSHATDKSQASLVGAEIRLILLLASVALLRSIVLVDVVDGKTPLPHQQLRAGVDDKVAERLV